MPDEIICPECGDANPAGSTWCAKDGVFLAWDGDESPEPVAPSPRSESPADAAPPDPEPGPRPDERRAGRSPSADDADDRLRTSGIRIHPPAAKIELVDAQNGRVQLAVDNTAKHERRLTLSASDKDRVLQFEIEPHEVLLQPNQRVMVELRLTTPHVGPGTVTDRTVAIVAEEGGRPVSRTIITFQQRISSAPSTTAISRPMRGDRQNSPRPRPVSSDAAPTMAAQSVAPTTAFDPSSTRRVSSATARTTLTDGPGTSATTFLPLAGGRVRLEPPTIHLDGGSRGTFLVVVDNSQGREPLRVDLQHGDGERSVRYDFRPDTFEVPPAEVVASTLVVTAPPSRQSGLERGVYVRAQAGDEIVDCAGTLVQRGSLWLWLATYLLPVLGLLIAVLGAISPLTTLMNFYWFHRPDPVGPASGGWWQVEPASSQPAFRIVIIVLAIAMAFGLGFRGGLVTRVAAVAMFVVVVGYGFYTVFAPIAWDTGGMSWGFCLMVLAAVLGYVGGSLRGR